MWAQPSNPSTLLDSFLVANLPQNQTLGLGGEEWTNQFTWVSWKELICLDEYILTILIGGLGYANGKQQLGPCLSHHT